MPSSKTTVSVLTGRGMAAISSIALAGADAKTILGNVFQTSKTTARQSLTVPHEGEIFHGSIADGQRVIDEVVIACEKPETFVIHCHGNPLLVEQIVSLLQSHGAALIDAEEFIGGQRQTENSIETETQRAMRTSATLTGVKIARAQIETGLSAWAQRALEQIDSLDMETLRQQCVETIERGVIAQRIIEGVQIVIAGPPNSGKSTLLNCLAGTEQVIVSETAGTTRDWVSVTGALGDGILHAEFIDTAGLDEELAGNDQIEQTAQGITKELLASCDLVLYVQDITQQAADSRQWPQVPVIYIHNKCDLARGHKSAGAHEPEAVFISAKDNTGIDNLVQEILVRLGVENFDITKPAAFTQRQRNLLSAMIKTDQSTKEALSELLYSKDSI